MYLGIDLGTSGVKALIIDDDQTVVVSANEPLDVTRPQPGWSEQDPAAWIAATERALDQLAQANGAALSAVRGIGLSGQMHGATLLDAADDVIRPCILWNDTRAHAEAAALDAMPGFRAISGNIVFPGFTAPKLDWVRRHEPDAFARVRKVLLPKDYLRLWLTGDHVADMCDASGTAWLDTGARSWSPTLLGATEMPVEAMPRLVESTEAAGALRGALASRWGMRPDVIVAGGAGDSAASAVGVGAVEDGAAFVSLGTSGVVLAANDAYRPMPESAVHTFCHAIPGAWHQIGVMLTAASALTWHAGIVGGTPTELIDELGDSLRAPGPTTFLPYLSGERTPHNSATIRGLFAGLAHETDRAALTQAVLEGVAFAMRDNLEALRQAGADPVRVMAVGGGSRSHYWLEAVATSLGVPVDIPTDSEVGAAFGAARLGMIAATLGDPREICAAPRIQATIEPSKALEGAFGAAYERFKRLGAVADPSSR